MIAAAERSANQPRRPRVLVLSKSYPNKVLDVQGLWVENLVRHSSEFCDPKVISPVQYCPPLPWLPEYYNRFRTIPLRCITNGIEVFHPRLFTGPGYSLHSVEAEIYYWSVYSLAKRLRRDFPFDLIHAHFTYPDGAVAVRLGKRFGVPVIITEQNPWGPWLDSNPTVRRKSIEAARGCTFHIAISSAVRKTIVRHTGESAKLRVIPDAVDGDVFRLPENGRNPVPGQIIFVGAIRPVKGVDVLFQAVRILVASGRRLKLVLVGESFFKGYRREYERLQQMSREPDLAESVHFAGKQSLPELVHSVQQSALLVLPSRAESFGMVLVEALACGTPVVATRCGGPEDIVNDEVGVLVPPEDPEALARGIAEVLDRPRDFEPSRLRAYALEHFGLEAVGRRLADLYGEALEQPVGSVSAEVTSPE